MPCRLRHASRIQLVHLYLVVVQGDAQHPFPRRVHAEVPRVAADRGLGERGEGAGFGGDGECCDDPSADVHREGAKKDAGHEASRPFPTKP